MAAIKNTTKTKRVNESDEDAPSERRAAMMEENYHQAECLFRVNLMYTVSQNVTDGLAKIVELIKIDFARPLRKKKKTKIEKIASFTLGTRFLYPWICIIFLFCLFNFTRRFSLFTLPVNCKIGVS